MKKYTIKVTVKSYKDIELGERKLKGDLIEVTEERAKKLVSLGLVEIVGIEEVNAKVKTKATTEKEVRANSPKAKKESKPAPKKTAKKETPKKA